MTIFTPTFVLGNMMDICDKHNETHKKNLFKGLCENLGYCAPEILEDRFWYGNYNWFGIIEILNRNFDTTSDCNVEINKYFKDVLKTYNELQGFDKLR